MNTPLLVLLFALVCGAFATTMTEIAHKQEQCAVGASAVKRANKIKQEVETAISSLQDVIKELLDIPKVLITETVKEGVQLVQESMEGVGKEIKTQIDVLVKPMGV